VRDADRVSRRAVSFGFLVLSALLALGLALPAGAQTTVTPLPELLPQDQAAPQKAGQEDGALPLLSEPPASGAKGPDVAHLSDAIKQMNSQNPVVARVNGHDIYWMEVVESADDLPERYREQIETVFPALLDRLVNLRLLADAAREQGLRDDPDVQQLMESYEDRVLSSTLLERILSEKVTAAALRQRYDALVALRRSDREIRARHILVETEEEAENIIARLDAGDNFAPLAVELSQGSSAGQGGDLGYFHPSRMAPAFAEAALALEPEEFSREPVETEFGWHVILLVDRRADDIPSFLDMQETLHQEAKKEAVDRLVLSLRHQASLEMFPEDAVKTEETAEGASVKATDAK